MNKNNYNSMYQSAGYLLYYNSKINRFIIQLSILYIVYIISVRIIINVDVLYNFLVQLSLELHFPHKLVIFEYFKFIVNILVHTIG